MWKDFMKLSHSCYYKTYKVKREGADPAVILYSGGTTGTTKGIVLTNKNFNALGQQVIAANPMFRDVYKRQTLALDEMVCADMRAYAPDCIVADSMAVWGKAVAKKLGIPFILSLIHI